MLVAGGVVVIIACGGGGDNGTKPCTGADCGGGPLVHASRVTATTAIIFSPSAVTIPAGDTIYYTFESVQHNVVFDTPGNPGNVPNTHDATVKRKFPTAGTFAYHCSIHPSMTGSITVNP
jgi:plastocyanin